MHDPMTVAFDIKYPWFRRGAWPHHWTWLPASWRSDRHWKKGYRETFATIWHVDPETDGTDNSCGWTFPNLTASDRAFAKELADWEERHPYYFAQPTIRELRSYEDDDNPGERIAYRTTRISAGDCVALCADLFARFRWQLDPKRRRHGLTPKLMAAAFSLGAASGDNLQASFALSDDDRKTEWRRREAMERPFLLAIRDYRRVTRPWWRHPRWHVHHWQVRIHPLQAFKRWAFSRCETCGRRFPWGASVVSTSWSGPGPRWFRGEPRVHHPACIGQGVAAKAPPAPAPVP